MGRQCGGGGLEAFLCNTTIKTCLKKTKKYNTNKKVTQYSGIQCVSWDETTIGEKAFWAERIAEF